MRITVLAGGVGAARLLLGMVRVVPPAEITAVVNTGDDTDLHGLHISPDIDTVTYTLAGAINRQLGWGLEGETWQAMEALERFAAVRPAGSGAGVTWFRLGDRDLATHLYRTHRLREGAPLSTVTDELRRAWRLGVRLLPMTDDRVRTMVSVVDPGSDTPVEVAFQEYFVGRRHSVPVTAVRFDGAAGARPAPGVVEAIEQAEVVVVAPSNPIVSIGPVLAVPGVLDALTGRRDRVIAVSPIVAGAALKGPADRMLVELGHDASVVGVARLYRGWCSALVIDHADASSAPELDALDVRAVVTGTVMRTPGQAAELAEAVLAAAGVSV